MAARCVGLHIDPRPVADLRDEHGFRNFVCCDLAAEELADIVVLGGRAEGFPLAVLEVPPAGWKAGREELTEFRDLGLAWSSKALDCHEARYA